MKLEQRLGARVARGCQSKEGAMRKAEARGTRSLKRYAGMLACCALKNG